jgi:hypothetical protein
MTLYDVQISNKSHLSRCQVDVTQNRASASQVRLFRHCRTHCVLQRGYAVEPLRIVGSRQPLLGHRPNSCQNYCNCLTFTSPRRNFEPSGLYNLTVPSLSLWCSGGKLEFYVLHVLWKI